MRYFNSINRLSLYNHIVCDKIAVHLFIGHRREQYRCFKKITPNFTFGV